MNKVNKNIIIILQQTYLSARKRGGVAGVEAIDQDVRVAGNAMLMRGPETLNLMCCGKNGPMVLDPTSQLVGPQQLRETGFETNL